VACQLPSISPAVKPVIAATLRRFSTSVLISIRAPHSVTKATIPNQIATPRANAEYVRQSRIDPTPRICPPSFRKLYKARARIEQAVGKLKRFKRIALRCEKTAQNYGSFVALALGFILIKSVHTA
jgi:hypothetical protein